MRFNSLIIKRILTKIGYFPNVATENRIKAVKINPKDITSPWISLIPFTEIFQKCRSLDEFFRMSVQTHGDKRSLGFRPILSQEYMKLSDGQKQMRLSVGAYEWITYNDADKRVERIAKGLRSIGVSNGDRVLIFAETGINWFLAAHSIFRIGGVLSTLYTSMNDESLLHVINETEAEYIIMNHHLIGTIGRIGKHTPKLKTVIVLSRRTGQEIANLEIFAKNTLPKLADIDLDRFDVTSLIELERIGKEITDPLEHVSKSPDDVAVIMYTSGSSGVPKGVLLTNKNIIFAAQSLTCNNLNNYKDDDVYMAFLPLAHIFEFISEIIWFSIGIPIGYATPHTLIDKSPFLVDNCPGDATLLQPTLSAAVPLVFERLKNSALLTIQSKGPLITTVIKFAYRYKSYKKSNGMDTPILDALIFRRFQNILGGRMRIFYCGGAPLSPDTQKFVENYFSIKIIQGYGSTETAAISSVMTIDDHTTGRVGPPLSGIKLKLIDWTEGGYSVSDMPYPRGEIVIGGDCVAKGYYKLKDLTRESFTTDDKGVRWFQSGDIGEMNEYGTLKIIDRKKDIIKLQNGEFVSLAKIEQVLRKSPFVGNICVYGDSNHTNIVALISPIKDQIELLAHSMKIKDTYDNLCNNTLIEKAISNDLRERAIKGKLKGREIPYMIKLCIEEWTPVNGLLTPSLKIVRKNIRSYYWNEIKKIYKMP